MESSTPSESTAVPALDHPRLPAFVDWLVGALVVLGGLVLALGGSAIWLLVDRTMIAEAVAEGDIQSDAISGPELVDVVSSTATWTGIGLLITGLLMLVVGVAFVALRHRARVAGGPTSDYFANALTGAIVSGILSFVPFSPVIGGGVAGYFERGESERVLGVGALSGLLGMAPVAMIATFTLAGVSAGLFAVGETGLGVFLAIVMVVVLMIVATIGAGLGALGGYVGGRFAEDRHV